MRRALILGLAGVTFAACAAQAGLCATTSVPVHVQVTQFAGIQIGNGMTLPAVSVAPVSSRGLSGVGVAASAGRSAGGVGNAQLTIRGQPGDVVSTTVPESFTVVRSGGQETLTVKTNTSAEYQIGSGDVVLGGAYGSTMSVDVGGSLALASAQNLVPGPYEGMLVVVVQYN